MPTWMEMHLVVHEGTKSFGGNYRPCYILQKNNVVKTEQYWDKVTKINHTFLNHTAYSIKNTVHPTIDHYSWNIALSCYKN